MKKIILVGLAVFIIIVASMYASRQKRNEAEYVVKIGYLPIMPSRIPYEIALQEGFFEEEGVKVLGIELQSSNLLVDALIRKDVDITPESSIIPYFTAEATDPGKMKVFAVTDLTTENPFDSIIVKSDSSIKSLEDLKGKKIGVYVGSTATNVLKLFLKQKGIDSSLIQFVQLPPAQHLTALEAGSIDALFAYEPAVSIGVSKGMKLIYGSVFAELVNHNPLGAGIINASFIEDYPEESRRVVTAINRAFDFMRTNEEETREISKIAFNLDSEVAKVVSLPYGNHSDEINKETVQKLVDLFVSAGELKVRPNMEGAYYSIEQ